MTAFATKVLGWFDEHGRKDLPWQTEPNPYRVWISEIMLQQTQVATVIPYYTRFMSRFPTVGDLASADIDQVLHLWTGLGYYARARNLHRAAQLIADDYDGRFPQDVDTLESLPGIGRSTAGAIAALAMGVRAAILDGNVKRVLTRHQAITGYPEQTAVKKQLWLLAESLLPKSRVADYTQAMMDLGSLVCTRTRPTCERCPLQGDCLAREQDLIAQIPGKKPKKILPVKAVTMYILQNDASEVLLEKRPPQGIWGGLYSFPEGPGEQQLPGTGSLPGYEPGTSPSRADLLTPLRHTFSHYHLDIQPVRLRAGANQAAVAESDQWLWYPLDHSLEVGLAAPVKKLLTQLAATPSPLT